MVGCVVDLSGHASAVKVCWVPVFLPESPVDRNALFTEQQHLAGTPYRVIRLVGNGGMGAVYEVEHELLGKRFILKTLLQELVGRDDIVRRLRTEWRALGRLDHKNIVSVSDAGMTANGTPYFVMELLRGETVYERLVRVGPMSEREALRVAQGIFSGLAAAHDIGVVHRDIKPANIYLTTRGDVKVLDFGVAKVLGTDRGVTMFGATLGTPKYMSPEQATGGHVSGQADVYAVGVVLFEMLTGKPPFTVTAPQLQVAFHAEVSPPTMKEVAPHLEISEQVELLVADLLKKDPLQRPEGPRTALRRISMLLEGDASSTGQPAGADSLITLTETPAPCRDDVRRADLGESPHTPTLKLVVFEPDGAPTRTAAAIDDSGRISFPTPSQPAPESSVARRRYALGLLMATGVGGAAAGAWLLMSQRGALPAASAASPEASSEWFALATRNTRTTPPVAVAPAPAVQTSTAQAPAAQAATAPPSVAEVTSLHAPAAQAGAAPSSAMPGAQLVAKRMAPAQASPAQVVASAPKADSKVNEDCAPDADWAQRPIGTTQITAGFDDGQKSGSAAARTQDKLPASGL